MELIIDSLAFGLANIYFNEMNTENAKSLIVGSKNEIYNQKTAQIIYDKVLAILKAN
jgi:hypothetical protein